MKRYIRKAIGLASLVLPRRVSDFLVWPIATRLLGLGYKEKIYLRDGFYMMGSMEDILSREILFFGEWKSDLWERETLKKLSELSSSSKNVLIAGAHMGYLVLYAAHGGAQSVHSFEPISWLYDRCLENISLNPDLEKRITLTRAALGGSAGEIELFEEGIRSSSVAYSGGHVEHNNVVRCRVVTIDQYVQEKGIVFDLILLDIEGYEWFALDGAKIVLESKPVLILEVSPRVLSHTKITPQMIFGRLSNMGYKIFFLDDYGDKTVPYSSELESYYLDVDYINILAVTR